jgi:site-specific DNA recombinase
VAEKFLAEYFRLSVEDGDVVLDDTKAESDSISHQRELITRYVRDKQLYPAVQILEFVDDGYSGTNFDRPAVKEMLSLVREGKVCCIIVKDLSRFGRNYLEVGDYLEQIFPFMGVRFIAINDGYDSNDHIGTTGGIEIAFKSLLYDMYSKDLSEKMRSSLLVRRKRGDFIGPRAPFGYQFSKNKKVLAVDEVAAQYVRRIFGLACEGYGTGKIAQILNKEKIPTPGWYKNREKQQYHIMDGEGYWNCGKVRKVLQNKVYMGTVVNGRTKVTEVGGSHFRQVPDAEQICVPDMHEAIITEQEFLLASEVIKNNGQQKGKKHNRKEESVLLGKLRCGHCKRSLVRLRRKSTPCFICKKSAYEQGSRCISERLSEPELEAAVLERINQELGQEILVRKNQKSEAVFSTMDNRSSKLPSVKEMKKMCMVLEQKQDSLKREKQYLYEQYKLNQMERRTYLNRVGALREEESSLNEQLQKIQEERDRREEESSSHQEEVEYTGKMESLTKEVVDEWIEAIYVYGKTQFDIVYKEKIKKSKKSIKNC